MGIFDRWTICFVEASFSSTRIRILEKIVRSNDGHAVKINLCDKSTCKRLAGRENHVFLVDAKPDQTLKHLFSDCPDMQKFTFYSADWVADSVKRGAAQTLDSYKIQDEENEKDQLLEELERSRLPPHFNNSRYDCFRAAPLDHRNNELVHLLSKIAYHRYLTGNARSELSYNRAIAMLKSYPKDIESVEEAGELQNIGPKITGLIGEFLATGKILAAEEIKVEGNEELSALDAFTKMHGVGPATAQMWYHLGLKSMDDVKQAIINHDIVLKEDQNLGLKYYDDFQRKLSRREVEEIFSLVKDAIERRFGETVVAEMTGGYRRGKILSGDVDILIHPVGTSPSKTVIMNHLLAELKPCIKDILSLSHGKGKEKKDSHSLDICLMAFQVSPSKPVRRVDFIVSTKKTSAFAMLGWTGSRQFERSIRLFAEKELGMKLTDHSLVDSHGNLLDFEDERAVFNFLGVPYQDPNNRNF